MSVVGLVVSILTFLPLLIVAFAHLLWSLGTNWPLSGEAVLAQAVIGTPNVTRMPNRFLVFLIAVLLLIVAISAMALADHDGGGIARTSIGAIFGLIFVGRGALAYTDWWRERHPTEPFASLDRRNYAPLCFWIGAGFLIMAGLRLI
jgi:hypothetical protein